MISKKILKELRIDLADIDHLESEWPVYSEMRRGKVISPAVASVIDRLSPEIILDLITTYEIFSDDDASS